MFRHCHLVKSHPFFRSPWRRCPTLFLAKLSRGFLLALGLLFAIAPAVVTADPSPAAGEKAAKAEELAGEALALAKEWKLEEAVAKASEALASDPKNVHALLVRGESYRSLRQLDKALEDTDLAARLAPKDTWAFYFRGMAYFDKNITETALQDFDEAVTRQSVNARAVAMRGVCYAYLEKKKEARADINRAVELKPNDLGVLGAQAHYRKAQNDFSGVIFYCDAALQRDPQYLPALMLRAEAYHVKEMGNKALADANAILKILPNCAKGYIQRGWAYNVLKENDQALAAFNKAVELGPNDPDPYDQRAFYYKRREQYDKAIADFEKAAKLGSSHGRAPKALRECRDKVKK